MSSPGIIHGLSSADYHCDRHAPRPSLSSTLAIEDLHRLLICDPDAGTLTWRLRTPDLFAGAKDPERACKSWNTRFAEKPAINSASSSTGYLDGAILGVGVTAHRVIFAMVHGYWPIGVDHINGHRRDNRIQNLREAGQAENMRNASLRSDNPSGHAGIWQLRCGDWRARIKARGELHDLGRFADLGAAIEARKAAEARLGFHPNHGRAA